MPRTMLNIIYTNTMAESVRFYERLGFFRREDGDINDWWNEFPIGDASLALHWNNDEPLPTGGQPELNFRISAAEFDALYESIGDLNPSAVDTLRGLGRYFTVTDPSGVNIQFNEH